MDENDARTLGRIEGKVDMILEALKNDTTRMNGFDTRLNGVERKVWYSSGLAVGLSVVLAKLGIGFPHA